MEDNFVLTREKIEFIYKDLMIQEYQHWFAGIDIHQPLMEEGNTSEGKGLLMHIENVKFEKIKSKSSNIGQYDAEFSLVRLQEANPDGQYRLRFTFANFIKEFSLSDIKIEFETEYEDMGILRLERLKPKVEHNSVQAKDKTIYLDEVSFIVSEEDLEFLYLVNRFTLTFDDIELSGTASEVSTPLIKNALKFIIHEGDDSSIDYQFLYTALLVRGLQLLKQEAEGYDDIVSSATTSNNTQSHSYSSEISTNTASQSARTEPAQKQGEAVEDKPSKIWLFLKIGWLIWFLIDNGIFHDLYYFHFGRLVDANGNTVQSLPWWYYGLTILFVWILISVIKDIKKLLK